MLGAARQLYSESMTIDKLKFHEDSAQSVDSAAAHIAVFLTWAAKHGYLADHHDHSLIHADSVRYVVEHCPSLTASDFTDAASEFVRDEYPGYLEYLDEKAEEEGVTSYVYASSAAGAADLAEYLEEVREATPQQPHRP